MWERPGLGRPRDDQSEAPASGVYRKGLGGQIRGSSFLSAPGVSLYFHDSPKGLGESPTRASGPHGQPRQGGCTGPEGPANTQARPMVKFLGSQWLNGMQVDPHFSKSHMGMKSTSFS